MRKDCTDILKALADKTRMRIVKVLLSGPSTVTGIAQTLDLSQYNVSKHLRVLRQAGIVGVEPCGNRREYSVVPAFREPGNKAGKVVNFGCCRFQFDELAV